MAKRPGGAMIQGDAAPTRSQMMPILTKWGELGTKSQLIPMFVTIVAVLLMYVYAGSRAVITIPISVQSDNGPVFDPQRYYYTSPFIMIVATYLTLLSLYFIYRLAGKRVSWIGMLTCTFFTGYYIWLMGTQGAFNFIYEFFHGFLAGGEPDDNLPFFTLFYRHYVGTGFFEEFVKAAPLLIIVFTASKMSPGIRKHFNIEEPLDGIVYGAAAGGGFALMETVGQYISRYLVRFWERLGLDIAGIPQNAEIRNHFRHFDIKLAHDLIDQGKSLVGAAPGIELLIPRSLDNAFGHMAYSGYFGYFIGLSVLKPEKRWRILIMGLCSASLPHALWDCIPEDQAIIQTLVALLSYGLLAAAILKAREISPNRQKLQRSVVFGDFGKSGVVKPAAIEAEWAPVPAGQQIGAASTNGDPTNPAPYMPPPQPAPMGNVLPPAPPNLPEGTPCLRIGPKYLIIVPGLRILDHQAPGLVAVNAGGPVAEVTRNPQDPSVLGLTNLSRSTWEVVSASGTRRSIQTGQTVKLSTGTRIDFGPIDGEVR